jgi:hypothetical protein
VVANLGGLPKISSIGAPTLISNGGGGQRLSVGFGGGSAGDGAGRRRRLVQLIWDLARGDLLPTLM